MLECLHHVQVAAHLAQVVIDSMLVPYMTAYVQHAKSPVSSS
jgi:hypothetical protein